MGRNEETARALLADSIALMRRLASAGLDNSLAGAVGELYAEVVLGMIPAPRGARAFDGWINGRTVSVKTREKPSLPSKHYATVRTESLGKADELLLVWIDEDGNPQHVGPVPFSRLAGKERRLAGRVIGRDFTINEARSALARGE